MWIWTLQEVIIPRSGLIACGRYEWDLDDFLGVVEWLFDNQGQKELGGATDGLLQRLKVAEGCVERHG